MKLPKIKTLTQQGFTLVELLVVIAILGILAAGLLIAINPVERINAANDTKVYNDLASVSRSLEAYAANHDGTYVATGWTALTDLTVDGSIKNIPSAPNGYTTPSYTYTCTGSPCTSYIVYGQVKSQANIQKCVGGAAACSGGAALKFMSTGKACVVPQGSAATTNCP